MIRVLYILVGEGGSDKALLSSIKCMRVQGIEPVVVARKEAVHSTLQFLEQEDIPYRLLDYDFYWYPFSKSFVPYFFRHFNRLLKLRRRKCDIVRTIKGLVDEYKVDIIHTNTTVFQFGWEAAGSLHIPHVWHIREYQLLDFNHVPIYSFSYLRNKMKRAGNYNIAVTKGLYDFYHLNSCNSQVIYDGILEGGDRKEKPLSKGSYFLFVGRVQEEKGALLLLNAFVEYVKKGGPLKLFYAGSLWPECQVKLDTRIQETSISDRVVFLGAMSSERINVLMTEAVATVIPSQFEAFGLVMAEAMFNQCLVIGKNCGGTKEQFDNGLFKCGHEIGLRFETQEELSTLLWEVTQKGVEYYSDIVAAAALVVSDYYSMEKNVRAMVDLYNKILLMDKL